MSGVLCIAGLLRSARSSGESVSSERFEHSEKNDNHQR